MEIFIDTAIIDEIKEAASYGLVDGVTTNPSLAAKAGKNYVETLKEISQIVDGPISAEVVSEKAEDMVKEAEKYTAISKNIAIKVPMTLEGMKAVRMFKEKGIMTNVTLVFSANQALLAAKAGATFVSPFVGRLDDIGHTGMELIEEIVQIYDNYGFETKVLVASVRHPEHVKEAALLGADVCTVPYKVLMQMAKHALTDVGIKKFLADWEKVPK
ncbi:fructose-6-phosphate aldolase [Candidatus Woesearchaeota archaeon]|nr:MAG: fructose-6-phosphate aldolase [Candidatus Woesearchaeota archaeon]